MQQHLAASAALLAAAAALCLGAEALRTAGAPEGRPLQLRVPLQRRPAQSDDAGGDAGALSFLQTAASSGRSAGAASALDSNPAYGAPPVDIFGQIRVGTPPKTFDVAIDTGSSNLLLTSATCRSVGCLAHKTYSAAASSTARPMALNDPGAAAKGEDATAETVFLDISTGQAEGDLIEDTVCLGNQGDVCATTGFVQMTKMTQTPFNTFPYDGILGVGMPQGSLDKRFNFLGNLAQADKLKRDRFSVWLANENDTESSEIIFGELAQDKLGSEIQWLPVSGHDTGMWQASMSDMAVDNVPLNLCGSAGCQAAFDTGTDAIAMPSEQVEALIKALDIKQDCSTYDVLPLLGFSFHGTTLNIDKRDYVKKVGGQCYHQFLAMSFTGPKKDMILLGDPFLKRYMTTFDRESLKIGVALSVHRIPPGWHTTTAQLAAKFIHQTSKI